MRRDPFARTELKRETLTAPGQRCSWCGQERKRLYVYSMESDGGTNYGPHKGQFCNLQCHDDYHKP